MAVTSGDILRIVCKMSWGEDDIQNVYHGVVSGTGIPSNEDVLDDIVAALDTSYDIIDAVIPDVISFDSIEVYNLTQEEYLGETIWNTLTQGGNTTNDPLPPQVAPLVLFNTGTLGSQGRKFLPPFTEGQTDADGTPSAGVLATLATFANSLLDGILTETYDVTLGNYRPLADVLIEWTSAVVRDIWATQRRRYFGRGT